MVNKSGDKEPIKHRRSDFHKTAKTSAEDIDEMINSLEKDLGDLDELESRAPVINDTSTPTHMRSAARRNIASRQQPAPVIDVLTRSPNQHHPNQKTHNANTNHIMASTGHPTKPSNAETGKPSTNIAELLQSPIANVIEVDSDPESVFDTEVEAKCFAQQTNGASQSSSRSHNHAGSRPHSRGGRRLSSDDLVRSHSASLEASQNRHIDLTSSFNKLVAQTLSSRSTPVYEDHLDELQTRHTRLLEVAQRLTLELQTLQRLNTHHQQQEQLHHHQHHHQQQPHHQQAQQQRHHHQQHVEGQQQPQQQQRQLEQKKGHLETAEMFEVIIYKKNGSFGFNLKSKGGGQLVFVSNVVVGGSAFNKGVKKGDIIHTVNRVNVDRLTLEDIVKVVGAGCGSTDECRLMLIRPLKPEHTASNHADDQTLIAIDITKPVDDPTFGFNISEELNTNDVNNTIFKVSWVGLNLPAHKAGLLCGDVIHTVNQQPINSMIDTFTALSMGGNTACLVVGRATTSQPTQTRTTTQTSQSPYHNVTIYQDEHEGDTDDFELTTSFSELEHASINTTNNTTNNDDDDDDDNTNNNNDNNNDDNGYSLVDAIRMLSQLPPQSPDFGFTTYALPPLTPYWDRKRFPKPKMTNDDITGIKLLLKNQHQDHNHRIFRLNASLLAVASPHSNTNTDQIDTLKLEVLNAIKLVRRDDREHNEVLRTGKVGKPQLQRAELLTNLDFLPRTSDELAQVKHLLVDPTITANVDRARDLISQLETKYPDSSRGHVALDFIHKAWETITTDSTNILDTLSFELTGRQDSAFNKKLNFDSRTNSTSGIVSSTMLESRPSSVIYLEQHSSSDTSIISRV